MIIWRYGAVLVHLAADARLVDAVVAEQRSLERLAP